MKIAVVGATGMVGCEMVKVLEEFKIPVTELIPVASESSFGKKVEFKGKSYSVIGIEQALSLKPDIALFSAGGALSQQWAPRFAEMGVTVIDNSSAWRMDPNVKLVVPEINGSTLTKSDKIIANPNCSTIQLVMVLSPIHREFGVNRVVISTYQSVTGTGVKAVQQLEREERGEKGDMVYPYAIHRNCIPHCDVFMENGYTKEEMKLVNETVKILGDEQVRVTATAVRVPVVGGHSESVNISVDKAFEIPAVRKLLAETKGVQVQDNTEVNAYPTPNAAQGKNDVFVGRIRRDFTTDNTLNLWIVADNLRKGAATNAVQIAQHLIENKLV
ncbi:aspartate-semialdehyde dehydrogenase [Luteibaculum oceani]|uniref:Aspartate-semialdehyde dehydrogenase n=1 Tax=Luteibaculum oceani TaxID=1294296 RepID=A0A5C6VK36_9FLAO|nr:aspartate-semialdehyde dehydrogenase [Luteibaculum oceani]TXC85339.1 aspartate-semialdehyde dehydrogenase [Luteibaculum oceani]